VLKGGQQNLALRGGNHDYQNVLKLILSDIGYPTGQKLQNFLISHESVKQIKRLKRFEKCIKVEALGSRRVLQTLCGNQSDSIQDIIKTPGYPFELFLEDQLDDPIELSTLLTQIPEDTSLVLVRISEKKLAEEMGFETVELDSMNNVIQLANIKLQNPLTNKIQYFPKLQKLEFFDGFSTIPTEIGLLQNLQDFEYSNNKYTGPIPTEIGQLVSLKELTFEDSNLSSQIPTEIGQLSNLTNLEFWNNEMLRGEIPTQIGNLHALQQLIIDNIESSMSGPIPTEIYQLTKLKILDLSYIYSGSQISTQIGNLYQLEKLTFMYETLSGFIPTQIGLLQNLKELNFEKNELTGKIPTQIGLLRNLEKFNVSRNRLTGPIPSEIIHLTNINQFSVHQNLLTGSIPERPASWSMGYKILEWNENYLKGTRTRTSPTSEKDDDSSDSWDSESNE
jgi:Leucine-rich repeat (LRR) protein